MNIQPKTSIKLTGIKPWGPLILGVVPYEIFILNLVHRQSKKSIMTPPKNSNEIFDQLLKQKSFFEIMEMVKELEPSEKMWVIDELMKRTQSLDGLKPSE